MKLNLGCGFDKRDGFINADGFAACEPDVLMDIETTPWPFDDNSFDYILMKHVLEHVGAEFKDFKAVIRELYRVTKPGGIIEIHVPHYRHESFWSDPTHVRAFTVDTFRMMSKTQNDIWIANRSNYTMLAYVLGVDFEIVEAAHTFDTHWLAKEAAGEITRAELRVRGRNDWDVVRELQIRIKAVKSDVSEN